MALDKAKSNLPSVGSTQVVIIERTDWGATPPLSVENWQSEKVENIVMTTTDTDICNTREECIVRVRDIQKKDMEEGHPDIKYNFLVGENGCIYEGRGWKVSTKVSKEEGDKFSYLDGKCVYIAFIGPRDMLPSSEMFTALSGLSGVGVEQNMVGREVKIVRIAGDEHQVFDLNLDEAFDDEKERQKAEKQIENYEKKTWEENTIM